MRKVRVFLGMAVLLSALSVGAFAFQNEPEGFRELKWGDPPTEEMKYFTTASGIDGYLLPNDKMAIGNVKLYRIAYAFYKNQFEEVHLHFKGKDNYDLMKTICKERYGKAVMNKGFYENTWLGQKGFVFLKYDYIEEKGFLTLASTILMMKKLAAEKKKEAEKAAGDF